MAAGNSISLVEMRRQMRNIKLGIPVNETTSKMEAVEKQAEKKAENKPVDWVPKTYATPGELDRGMEELKYSLTRPPDEVNYYSNKSLEGIHALFNQVGHMYEEYHQMV